MKTRSNELNFAPSSPAGDMITETRTAGGEGDSQHQLTESGSGPTSTKRYLTKNR